MTKRPYETHRKGSDQELAAVEVTSNMVIEMTDYLFRQESQWQPEVVQELADAMANGRATLRIIFDTDASGLVSLKIYTMRPSGTKRLAFDIAPKYKLDS